MLEKLKFWNWFSKKELPPEEPKPIFPERACISIESLNNGGVFIRCFFPPPENDNHLQFISEGFAELLVAINTGQLLGTMQQALSITANNRGIDVVATLALDKANRLMNKDFDEEWAMLPTDVFSMKNGD